jgi:hypothetical protein
MGKGGLRGIPDRIRYASANDIYTVLASSKVSALPADDIAHRLALAPKEVPRVCQQRTHPRLARLELAWFEMTVG